MLKFDFNIYINLLYLSLIGVEIMIREIKKKLFFARFHVLAAKASQQGKITEFDDEIYEKMKGTIISCFPVSFFIKHSKHMFALGTCYERSLYMFLALDDAILVRGNNKDLEYNYGEGHGGHGWVEVGDYVYDPSTMLKYDKATYYELYGCTDVTKTDKETYLSLNQDFVNSSVSRDYNDFRPGGKRRLELGVLIMQVQTLASMLDDEEFRKDLDAYLKLVEYDADQIQKERDLAIQEMLASEHALNVISGKCSGIAK